MKLSTCAAVTMSALAAIPGRVDAAIVIDISDIGSDVVASTSGSADLTDLTAIDTALLFAPGEVTPSKGSVTAGNPGQTLFFKGADGPESFGTGGKTEASVGNGDFVGVFAVNPFAVSPVILLPQKYASGSALKGSSVFEGQSLESLGHRRRVHLHVGRWRTRRQPDDQGWRRSGTFNLGDVAVGLCGPWFRWLSKGEAGGCHGLTVAVFR